MGREGINFKVIINFKVMNGTDSGGQNESNLNILKS